MIFALILITNTGNGIGNFGIGLGNYPNGLVSLKFRSNPNMVYQLTLGVGGWGSYYDTYSSHIAIGGRALFGMGSGGNTAQYTHYLGAGAGIHSYSHSNAHSNVSGAWVVGEGFYEFEIFPNPAEIPLSLELGVALVMVFSDDLGLGLGPLFGIHFYF